MSAFGRFIVAKCPQSRNSELDEEGHTGRAPMAKRARAASKAVRAITETFSPAAQ